MVAPDAGVERRGLQLLLLLAQLVLGAAIVAWLVGTGRFQVQVYRELFDSDQAVLAAGIVLLQLVALTTHVFRWWDLAHMTGVEVPLSVVLRTGFQGLFVGLVTPGSAGIDGVRIIYLQRKQAGRRAAGLASILMDRLTGYVGLLVVGTLGALVFALQQPGLVTAGMFAMTFMLLVVMLLLATLSLGHLRLPGERLVRRVAVLDRTLDSLRLYAGHRHRLIRSLALAITTHLLFSIAWCLGIWALDGSPDVAAVVSITAVLTIARSLPLTPMGLGVTDTLAEVLYRLVELDAGAELEMLMRATGMLVFLLAGLAFIRRPAPGQT